MKDERGDKYLPEALERARPTVQVRARESLIIVSYRLLDAKEVFENTSPSSSILDLILSQFDFIDRPPGGSPI